MKKIFPALVLASILAFAVLPLMVSAQQEGPQDCCKMRRSITIEGDDFIKDKIVGPVLGGPCTVGGKTESVDMGSPKWGVACLMNTLNAAVDWIFVVLIAIVIIFVLIGGITILTSAGDPGKVQSGRNYIMYAAIGLIIAFLARAIPAILKVIMGL